MFLIGGDLPVTRLGFGAMRLTGQNIWGDPPDRDVAISVLRRAVELGVDFIDTADSYGPFVSEELIAEALYPYDGVAITTKGGFLRPGPGQWEILGTPGYLRQCVEMSLRRLRLDTIELYQLHRIDPQVPLADQVGVLDDMRREGKIARIGLSAVSVEEIVEARLVTSIASVQNPYNLVSRHGPEVLSYCEREGLGFIPFYPMDEGGLFGRGGPLAQIAAESGATVAQLALAWLLHISPVTIPIPGTGSLAHLEENVAAAQIELTGAQMTALTALG
jgi:pyridoxine 4-dehydrogenase